MRWRNRIQGADLRRMAMRTLLATGLLATAASAGLAAGGSALSTNEAYVNDVLSSRGFDISDMKAVFAFVFKQLPERVKVYPTEHYYYFKFNHQGAQYSGNLRFQNEERDQGKFHFAYAMDFTQWLPPGDTKHVVFERKDGMELERIDDWTYKLTYDGKSVTFDLNKMEDAKPGPQSIGPDEKYLGPIFDESAVRFFLVYNPKLKQFLYILDESGPAADILVTSRISDRILMGQRTGFAFYRDAKLDRRILIGAFSGNSEVNNYFDGPFDQLPDNFFEGDTFRNILLEVDPELKGKIDRFGSSFDGETRYMIAPYMYYEREQDLAVFHRCATNRSIRPELYYACFAWEEKEGSRPGLAAIRLQREAQGEPRSGAGRRRR
ncbi:MAG: hypothetical protein IT538_14395 [Variibacter sp.]|nr:hypothetical protein [Variibacter sp.]